MNAILTRIAGALLVFGGAPGWAGTNEEILSVCRQFAAAQNTRDIDRAGAIFIDSPNILWVSDGRSFWGREAVLGRIGSFQKAERRHVTHDLEAANAVSVRVSHWRWRSVLTHRPATLAFWRASRSAAATTAGASPHC